MRRKEKLYITVEVPEDLPYWYHGLPYFEIMFRLQMHKRKWQFWKPKYRTRKARIVSMDKLPHEVSEEPKAPR